MTLGNKISDLRRQHNMSQDELAMKVNVSRQTISKWENDVVLPDVYNLRKVAEVFGISVDELLGNDVQPQQTNQTNQIIEAAKYGERLVKKHWQKYGYWLSVSGVVLLGFYFIVRMIMNQLFNTQLLGDPMSFMEMENPVMETGYGMFDLFSKIPLVLGSVFLIAGIGLIVYDRIKMNRIRQ